MSAGWLLLAACATPPPPQWQAEARKSIEQYQGAFLRGESKLADRYFAEAQTALASGADPELMHSAALVRCALGTATLDFELCASIARSAMGAEDRTYLAFLNGAWRNLDVDALSTQYRNVVKRRNDAERNRALTEIADPLSRLIAAGVLYKLGQISPAGIDSAIDAASSQGYRRPLLAWLIVRENLPATAADPALLRRVRERIKLLTPTRQ